MRRFAFLALVVLCGSARGDEWELVWSDEFAVDGRPDPTRWSFEEGFIRNHEAQAYTTKNARVERGVLVIEARKERLAVASSKGTPRMAAYTSASLTTKGKAAWTYGRIEVQAKIPTGRGAWPAIWLLGEDFDKVGWPRCGEIDVMENVGYDPDRVHFNVHTERYNHVRQTNKGASVLIARPYADFHTYAVEWTPKAMVFSVDGKTTFRFENEGTGPAAWPFDRPFFLILNVAVGGDWGGREGIDDAAFPMQMEVDYVRVYRRPAPAATR